MTKAYQHHNNELVSQFFSRDPLRISAWEFLRIGAWKSAYIPAALSVGNPEEIEAAMEQVLLRLKDYREIDVVKKSDELDWDKWQSDVYWMLNSTNLLKLPGVGYSFATALLSYLAPLAFPVMDRLTVGAIFGWDVARRPSKWSSTKLYRTYAETLGRCTYFQWNEKNIHERDMDLMNIMKPLEKSQGLCPIPNLFIAN